MIAKNLFKNPVLIIGILFLAIFLMGLSKKGYLRNARKNLIPTSCRATLVKLNRRIPANWKTECEGNNLSINITYVETKKFDDSKLRQYLYREVANNLIHIAKNSPDDNLERVDIVRLKYQHPKLIVNAVTEGKYLVKLATLKNKKLIAEHFKTTVQIQETK